MYRSRILSAVTLICFGASIWFFWVGIIPAVESDFKIYNWHLATAFTFLFLGTFLWNKSSKDKQSKENKPDYKHSIITISFGLFLLVLSILFLIYFHQVPRTERPVFSSLLWIANLLTRDLGIALIIAGVIAALLEIRNFINLVSKTVITALTSDEYLKNLNEEELFALKKSCSKKITEINYNRSEPNLNESLIDLESEISKQLFSPYYEKFQMWVECKELKPEEILIKHDEKEERRFKNLKTRLLEQKLHTRYTVINPKLNSGQEEIISTYALALPQGVDRSEIKRLIKLEKFEYTADSLPTKDLTSQITYNVTYKNTPSRRVLAYDVNSKMVNEDLSSILIPYDNKLVVDMVEAIYVPVDDVTYSRRLTKPTKYSAVFYMFKPESNQHVKLHGDCFCTMKEYFHGVTINDGSDYIEIICDAWLLPGQGFVITHMLTED